MSGETAVAGRADWAYRHPDLERYYETEWGLPVATDNGVFERLSLEGFQSGLSWLLILQRREAFRRAFEGFSISRVADMGAEDVERLLKDAAIIRNRQKIEAVIRNAQAALRLRQREGIGLAQFVWSYAPDRTPVPEHESAVASRSDESARLAKELKKHGFTFVGPTTVYALMCAIGMVDEHLVTSDRRGCSGLWNEDGTRAAAWSEVLAAAGLS